MTAKDARAHLARANEALSLAAQQLIAMPSGVLQSVPQILQKTEDALRKIADEVNIREEFQPEAQAKALESAIRLIRAQLRRVELLFDSAAMFYCGLASLPARQLQCYTVHGELQYSVDPGHLRLEA